MQTGKTQIGSRWAVALVLALALAVVAAGGSSARTSDLVTAKAAVAQFATVPAFVAPGPAIKATTAKGKLVYIVPAATSVPQIASMSALVDGIRAAGAAAGVKSVVCANNGQRSVQTSCLAKAVAQKAGVVVLVGPVDVVGLGSALATVKKAGIPVIASHVLAQSDFDVGIDPNSTAATDFNYTRVLAAYKKGLAGLTATVPAPYAQAAKLLADYVVAEANGARINLILSEHSDLLESAPMLKMVENEIAAQCPTTCSVSLIDVPYADWETDAISAVLDESLVRPTQYVVPLFDGMSGLAAEGSNDTRGASATSIRPNVCSFGGAPFAIQMGQAGNRVVCDVAENMGWEGWATMDQALRVLTGARPVASENLPLLLFNQASLNWFGNGMTFPPTIDAGWGDPASTYVAGYRQLWGLAPIRAT